MHYVICYLENKSLMVALDYLTEQGIEVGALVFDGLMIHQKGVTRTRLPEILQGFSQRVKEVVGDDITFMVKEMDEGYDILTAANWPRSNPYDYMDSYERLQETQLPPKEALHSRLTGEHISEEDYAHSQKEWDVFECKTLCNYHDLYLETESTMVSIRRTTTHY